MFLIDNVLLIYIYIYIYIYICRYLFNLKKKVKNKAHVGRQYVRRILLRGFQHLSHTISNLI
jgi:hypothetical protein